MSSILDQATRQIHGTESIENSSQKSFIRQTHDARAKQKEDTQMIFKESRC